MRLSHVALRGSAHILAAVRGFNTLCCACLCFPVRRTVFLEHLFTLLLYCGGVVLPPCARQIPDRRPETHSVILSRGESLFYSYVRAKARVCAPPPLSSRLDGHRSSRANTSLVQYTQLPYPPRVSCYLMCPPTANGRLPDGTLMDLTGSHSPPISLLTADLTDLFLPALS